MARRKHDSYRFGRDKPPAKVKRQALTSSCGKKGYMTKADAKLALRSLRALRREQREAGIAAPGKGEQATYRCARLPDGSPGCGLWHLTSLPKHVTAEFSRKLRADAQRRARRTAARRS